MVMAIGSTSTSLLVKKTKEDAMVRVNAANNASNNGADTNANSNTAVAQSKVVKTDTVELSQKSVALATTTQSEPTYLIQEWFFN